MNVVVIRPKGGEIKIRARHSQHSLCPVKVIAVLDVLSTGMAFIYVF